MKTAWQTTHKHTVAGRATTATAGHSHDLAEVEAAIARLDARMDDLAARLAALEATPPAAPPSSYPASLQATIDAAPAGSTVDVTGGPVYRELIKIAKPLTLVGARIDGRVSTNASAVGIEVANAQDVTLRDCTVSDVRYAGIMVSGSLRVRIEDCRVYRVDAGRQNANMNAYGIAVTGRGTRRSSDVMVLRAIVEDVPDWHGLDTHGGLRVQFLDCIVRRCNRAIFVTSSSLAPAAECEVSRNLCAEPMPRRDVMTTPPYNEVGLTVVKGCSAYGDGNVFEGWPAGNAINVQSGAAGTFTGTVIR